MRSIASPRRERGAVIITVALLMLFLLGFVGFAVDFGRLFIVKSELQTAMDACALSAAQELDGQADALTRATSAGLTAANLNRVNLQSATWDAQGQLTGAGISFRNGGFGLTTSPFAARYAECQHTQPAVQMLLMHAMGAFTGDNALFPNARNVAARAVATRAPAQSACPLPLALRPKTGTPPNYGFTVGEWVRLLMSPGTSGSGEIGWANLDGSNNAAETRAEVLGYCGTEIGDELGTPGVQAAIASAWNYRFGLYGGSDTPEIYNPDMSGYSYTALNWPTRFNAFDGPRPPMTPATATSENFITKRLAYANCADTGNRVRGANSCESITGLSLNSFSRVAAAGPTAVGGHRTYGIRSRIAPVPVVNGSNQVIDFACMFMLQPLTIPMADVYLEFRGNASDPGSPCVTAGIPGGTAGPLVPALVR
ncbi:pilus assembly protein [Ramlibacter tataouinensis]|uniref:pilus assembly protein TadG-related protein n=1 Tax=Ramlibacter tataouinensis TaxID=94132 RepID=UPI0022F3E530|nr:TadE/TadG family type IV pilus assembly protein [Ramlibacter tataouinensis]WBY02602.1 pilus assembly protein [Ramlibacter tataouinensis]